jgi:predicted PurR-regulated permease PerM
VIAAVLYAKGETAARGVKRFAVRLAGARGEPAVVLAGQAVRAVALGVVLTAIIQSALGGIGLVVAGIPLASILTGVMFFLGVCQIGPLPVLLPAIAWLYWRGDPFWGTALLVWSIPVGLLDNVLRPVLIRRGADLSMLLILPGVIGGLLAFGIIGLFIGPVVLAVAYTLLTAWVNDRATPPREQAEQV